MPDTTYTAAVRDTAGHVYLVRDAGPGLEHVFVGVPAKKSTGGWAPKAAKERLVRRLGTVVLVHGGAA